MVSIIFLPLVTNFLSNFSKNNSHIFKYFTLSGLSTDLTLLDNGNFYFSMKVLLSLSVEGTVWGYTITIIVTAFIGKFGGCTVAAHYFAGFNWRESSTIGSLMSCKGCVRLPPIVLF